MIREPEMSDFEKAPPVEIKTQVVNRQEKSNCNVFKTTAQSDKWITIHVKKNKEHSC